MNEPTISELSAAVKDVLEKRGVLSEVRAQLRTEVFKALDDKTLVKPKLCRENFLLNELIKDYLEYNKYNYTQSVLVTESGQPKEPLDRDFLARECNLASHDDSVPLLYQMLAYFMQRNRDSSGELDIKTKALDSHMPVSGTTCTIEPPTYLHTN